MTPKAYIWILLYTLVFNLSNSLIPGNGVNHDDHAIEVFMPKVRSTKVRADFNKFTLIHFEVIITEETLVFSSLATLSL